MSKQEYWYGYLEAGAKSSPVLRDDSIDTGNPNTMYLFNLEKGEILEYKREIIESKLRELKPKEKDISTKLKSAFKKIRASFIPKSVALSINTSDKSTKKPIKKVVGSGIFDLEEINIIPDDDTVSEFDEDEADE